MADEQRESDSQEFLPGYAKVSDFIDEGRKHVISGIRASNCFPTGLARDKFSTYPTFSLVVSSLDHFVTQISDNFLQKENGIRNIYIPDEDQRFNALEEANDLILERCNFKTDSIAGLLRGPAALKLTANSSNNLQTNPSLTTYRPREIVKPQLAFKDNIDNSNSLWRPIITYKPNSKEDLRIQELYDSDGLCVGYEHPYKFEIETFEPTEMMLKRNSSKLSLQSTDKTPLVVVDTAEKLDILLETLRNVNEIAVDVEHNDRRSFQGITCLIQISTLTTDYIIDVFLLREYIHLLNQSFTNPSILKVLHGANSDVLWLQRDFGVYLVGVFDTYHASKELNLSQKSLAALIKRYCNIVIDKKYQRADWRIRPLPNEMIEYARMDTHYLLFIWRLMREELLSLDRRSNDNLLSVFAASKNVCLRTYRKHQLKDDSYRDVLHRAIGKKLNNRQDITLKGLYDWRDAVARQEDESTEFILPNHMLLSLSEILPKEKEGVLEICLPKPALLLRYLHEIHSIILNCRVENLTAPQNDNTPSTNKPFENGQTLPDRLKDVDLKLLTTIKTPSKWDCDSKADSVTNSVSRRNHFKNVIDLHETLNTFKDFPMELDIA